MPQDEGWTHVKRKSRRNAPSRSQPGESSSVPDTFAPRTTGVLRPPEALRQDYDKIRTQWRESAAHQALIKLVNDHGKGLRMKKAVCLGIGTFDPEDGAWETKRAAYVQLCALETLVSQLALPILASLLRRANLSDRCFRVVARRAAIITPRRAKRGRKKKANAGAEQYTNSSIEIIFQEPIFTTSDIGFLSTFGHRVVPSPAAYALIDTSTLLFAVHLYRPIYAAALQTSLPAIFVGTGWDVWDTVTMEKSNDLENMKKMDERYTRHAFPQDEASTAFSSTSIYFMPPPEVHLAKEDDSRGGDCRRISGSEDGREEGKATPIVNEEESTANEDAVVERTVDKGESSEEHGIEDADAKADTKDIQRMAKFSSEGMYGTSSVGKKGQTG
ncbi:hypothetical protein PWT90_01984 [Aphanocladium album]|nr:hypothetical protein PWT90_01984 [Aphanocladium album]